ncbi:acetaldehyde dehydrogenase (acetylating) [Mycolicibacter minnesotensis]|uniref:Acetaldehyde dehydrogenase n=1 Tax=Mycolicibacter minnesotensis TaxID=1118379 RepID=A0A7I7R2X0_9MYCO|nr:acetaldehyde dehydrogenase (acetylating) [Mycolicibacter minnesotensis]ORB02180.1 acetaldehyde dehydrogenase (acetylating) [Mycolicibacter minnesotensis]BBY32476.1 acetaldehyde dehydrogenase [Mycolicibacter minnesotensis]
MGRQPRTPVAIIGSGNIGTDLMLKIIGDDGPLTVGALAGIDPDSDGLARALLLGVPITAKGIDGLLAMPEFDDIGLVFDATSATAHRHHWAALRGSGRRVVDLTPSGIGPYCVPVVNLAEHLDAPNLNMVTCGGQATVPIVAAVSQVGAVFYAETVAAISAQSAGPATRANIDDFTETTAAALRTVGGAQRSRAILLLNPADPPTMMRNTVYCLVKGDVDHGTIETSILNMVKAVQAYVPGYRLKQQVQFDPITADAPVFIPGAGEFIGTRVTVLLEVAGAAHYLPAYAGNLDIMTSAAKASAERIVMHAHRSAQAAR